MPIKCFKCFNNEMVCFFCVSHHYPFSHLSLLTHFVFVVAILVPAYLPCNNLLYSYLLKRVPPAAAFKSFLFFIFFLSERSSSLKSQLLASDIFSQPGCVAYDWEDADQSSRVLSSCILTAAYSSPLSPDWFHNRFLLSVVWKVFPKWELISTLPRLFISHHLN